MRIARHLADPDFCEALKRSGCAMLQIGLDSGSQKVLDGFSKGIDLKIAQRSLETLKQAEIATYVYLLFDTPWETELDTTPLDAGDLSLYRRFTHPAGWHRQKIRRFLDNKFIGPKWARFKGWITG